MYTLPYRSDAGGQRVARIGEVSATAYFGETELTDADVTTSSALVATRYYTHAGSTVAYQVAGGDMWLMFGDIQGSASLAINKTDYATTGEVVRNAYTPYGEIRGGDQLTDTDRGWLGQTEDHTTGLQYLNARYYDPTIGRFLSPDPLMSPGDPRTLDPYRYADNNPVVFTDATGLCPGCTPAEALNYGVNYGKSRLTTGIINTTGSKYKASGGQDNSTRLAGPSKGGKAAWSPPSGQPAGGNASAEPGGDGLLGWLDDAAQTVGEGIVNGTKWVGDTATDVWDGATEVWNDSVVPWWEEHGDEVLTGLAVVAAVGCIAGGIATAGAIAAACLLINAGIGVAIAADGYFVRDWSVTRVVLQLAFTAVSAGGAALLTKYGVGGTASAANSATNGTSRGAYAAQTFAETTGFDAWGWMYSAICDSRTGGEKTC